MRTALVAAVTVLAALGTPPARADRLHEKLKRLDAELEQYMQRDVGARSRRVVKHM